MRKVMMRVCVYIYVSIQCVYIFIQYEYTVHVMQSTTKPAYRTMPAAVLLRKRYWLNKFHPLLQAQDGVRRLDHHREACVT